MFVETLPLQLMYNPKFTTKSLIEDAKNLGVRAKANFHGLNVVFSNVYPKDHVYHDCAAIIFQAPGEPMFSGHFNLTATYNGRKDLVGTFNSSDDIGTPSRGLFDKYFPKNDSTWYRILLEKCREVYREDM